MSRWVQISGDVVTKSKRRYSRDEVEALIEKAARANGIDPASMRPTVDRLLAEKAKPVVKSSAQIERERVQRQRSLEADMERQRVARLQKSEQRLLELERAAARPSDVARAAIMFVNGDSETTCDADGPVTRLDLSRTVAKRASRGLFENLVDAAPTEPYTPRQRR